MKRPIWFVRKTYGYGWTPATWQGWLVIAVWIGLIIGSYFWLKQSTQYFVRSTPDFLMLYLSSTFFLVVLLLTVTWLTGEKPRWQWGPQNREKK
jgi:hypothetical protein